MVVRGVFGLEDDGRIAPQLPVSLAPMLFGSAHRISLYLDGRSIVLDRPADLDGALLVAGGIQHQGNTTEVQLVAQPARAASPPMRPMYLTAAAPALPLPGASGAGPAVRVDGPWPRHWTASRRGRYVAWLDYSNGHGPINTGITAAVKRVEVRCAGSPPQVMPVVMPQSEGWQASTTIHFAADAGASCTFSLRQGFNMSDLAQFAHYTGPPPPAPPPAGKTGQKADGKQVSRPRPIANGGATGPLNRARIGGLRIAPLAARRQAP